MNRSCHKRFQPIKPLIKGRNTDPAVACYYYNAFLQNDNTAQFNLSGYQNC